MMQEARQDPDRWAEEIETLAKRLPEGSIRRVQAERFVIILRIIGDKLYDEWSKLTED